MRAKDILIKPIPASEANDIVRKIHYSGKTVRNSQVHLGVFVGEHCGGALQFGPSLDKRRTMGLVRGTLWNEFIELNRMALADWLPKNSESRAIAVSMGILRKNYPWLKWVISFADGTQCGDGTIYRASGFVLTGIKRNTSIWEAPSGEVFTDIGVRTGSKQKEAAQAIISKTTVPKGGHVLNSGAASMRAYRDAGFKPKVGFQLRYVYFLHPAERKNLAVAELPFDKIKEAGASMYRGKRVKHCDDAPANQAGEGGSIPTDALQPPENLKKDFASSGQSGTV